MLDHLHRVELDLISDHKRKFGAFQQAVLQVVIVSSSKSVSPLTDVQESSSCLKRANIALSSALAANLWPPWRQPVSPALCILRPQPPAVVKSSSSRIFIR